MIDKLRGLSLGDGFRFGVGFFLARLSIELLAAVVEDLLNAYTAL